MVPMPKIIPVIVSMMVMLHQLTAIVLSRDLIIALPAKVDAGRVRFE